MKHFSIRLALWFIFIAACAASRVAAQEQSLIDVRLGWSSDRAIDILKKTIVVSDTVRAYDEGTRIIRLAPVMLAGLDGFLVLQIDTAGIIQSLDWTRIPYGRYARSEALNRYAGWNSWQTPTSTQIKDALDSIRAILGKGDEGKMVPQGVDPENADAYTKSVVSWKDGDNYIWFIVHRGEIEWRVWRRVGQE